MYILCVYTHIYIYIYVYIYIYTHTYMWCVYIHTLPLLGRGPLPRAQQGAVQPAQ